MRCKAGGWKCIRTRSDLGRKGSSASCGPAGMDTVDEEYDESSTPNDTRSSMSNPFGFNSEPFNLSNGSSSSVTPAQNAVAPQGDGDLTMAEDPTLSWLNMDLDSLLAQSLPPLDMSLYQSMGELAPIHSDTVPYGQTESSYAFTLPEVSSASYIRPAPAPTPQLSRATLAAPAFTPVTPQIQLILREFCKSHSMVGSGADRAHHTDDRFLGPAWAITYPPGTREIMLGRHSHVANSHLLNQKCKEAAAAICTCVPLPTPALEV